MRVELSNGGWAEFRDPEDVPEGMRRPIQIGVLRLSPEARALLDSKPDDGDDDGQAVALQLSADDLTTLYDINDVMVCALVEAWSFDAPCPPTPDTIKSLRSADYDALLAASSKFTEKLMPQDFGPDGVTDPDSPTTPSSD
jgi:hypothetical protein